MSASLVNSVARLFPLSMTWTGKPAGQYLGRLGNTPPLRQMQGQLCLTPKIKKSAFHPKTRQPTLALDSDPIISFYPHRRTPAFRRNGYCVLSIAWFRKDRSGQLASADVCFSKQTDAKRRYKLYRGEHLAQTTSSSGGLHAETAVTYRCRSRRCNRLI